MSSQGDKKRILFLMSDTGGGHRAAAEAIQAAMEQLYDETYDYELVDVFKDYTPFPFNLMPNLYPVWVNNSKFSWQVGYHLTNARRRSKLILDSFHLTWRNGVQRLFEKHDADVVVSVHSLFNRTALKTLNHHVDNRPPFITVVTDLVTTHAFWYQNQTDLIMVPTSEAYDRGVKYGMDTDKMQITGLPVHPNFVNGLVDTQQAREELGWQQDKLTVLMMSGGQGVGPVLETAEAINDKHLDIQLAIIAGSNKSLKAELDAAKWNQSTKIYGYRTDIARLMAGADLLITKAGPATISEACVAGLPMIISGFIPGQEDGNVEHVVDNKAGLFAPGPQKVADALEKWVKQPQIVRDSFALNAKQLGQPQAAWVIGNMIHQVAQNPNISPARLSKKNRRSKKNNISHLYPKTDTH